MAKYYAMTVDDYFLPSFCSGRKLFFGTLEQIAELVKALEAKQKLDYVVKAFQEFQNGHPEAKTYAAYNECNLLTSAELIAEQQKTLGCTEWDMLNIWQCVYNMHSDEVQVRQAVFRIQEEYHLCIQAEFKNLYYDKSLPITSAFWGFPEFFSVREENQNIYLKSRLYTVCDCYDSEQEALQAMQQPEAINLSRICEEILGDG